MPGRAAAGPVMIAGFGVDGERERASRRHAWLASVTSDGEAGVAAGGAAFR